MKQKDSLTHEPFWMDEPNPFNRSIATSPKGSLTWWISSAINVFAIFFRFYIFVIIVYFAIKYPILWIFVLPEAVILSIRMFFPRFMEMSRAKAVRIQTLAKEKTKADYIGSAVHTAGHPLLYANQKVVLALMNTELSLFSYESAVPVHTIPVNELLAVDLVTFDEDRIPHIGIIDNTAQALQLTFTWQGKTWICSLRRMYKVRPVEWYQAIQKARLV